MPSFPARLQQKDPSCKSEPADKATHHLEARQEIGSKSNVIKHPAMPCLMAGANLGGLQFVDCLWAVLQLVGLLEQLFMGPGCHNPRCISFVEAFAYHVPHSTHTWGVRVPLCGSSWGVTPCATECCCPLRKTKKQLRKATQASRRQSCWPHAAAKHTIAAGKKTFMALLRTIRS